MPGMWTRTIRARPRCAQPPESERVRASVECLLDQWMQLIQGAKSGETVYLLLSWQMNTPVGCEWLSKGTVYECGPVGLRFPVMRSTRRKLPSGLATSPISTRFPMRKT